MKNQLLFAILLTGIAGAVQAGPIERAVVEQTGPDAYMITFDAPKDAFPVRVFRILQPSRAGAATEVAPANQPRVEAHVPAGSGQPFFRLQPAKGNPVVVSIRRLPLEGAPNFRDLGGYRTSDGHQLRWGTAYRSGQLSGLTENDYKYLSSVGLRLVCDFRVDGERQRYPTKWKGEALPEIIASSIDTVSYAGQASSLAEHMQNVYRRMPFDAAQQYAGLIRRMINGDLPILWHCTAGKDRTGLFSALLLTILGVPRETVVEDFLLTNKYVGANSVVASNLDLGFQVINEKYGSVENYAREALKLSAEDLAKLRARLLEQACGNEE